MSRDSTRSGLRCNQSLETALLHNATMLIEKLTQPSHAARSTPMLLNLFDFRASPHDVAKKDGGLELPL